MIWSDGTWRMRGKYSIDPFVPEQVNPASYDIRIGKYVMVPSGIPETEGDPGYVKDKYGWWHKINLEHPEPFYENGIYMQPGQLYLVETLERIKVPKDCALELKMKSSRAREGFNHSMAFWFDPLWDGIGTMELFVVRDVFLPIYYGMKIAQVIMHQLDYPCVQGYAGQYNHASSVEPSKEK